MILTPKEIDTVEKALETAADTLTELGCDSVRFFATGARKGDQTVRFTAGRGNWFAQRGVVDDWVQGNKDAALANEIDPPQQEPPDEEWRG